MSSVLRISDAAILAFHAMLYVADHPDRLVSTKEIAVFHNASEAHLSKVMQRLVKAGFIKSIRGPKGGFESLRNPDDVQLLEVYELFEGTLDMRDCLLDSKVCEGNDCVFGSLLGDLNALVKEYLVNTKLGDVVKKQTINR